MENILLFISCFVLSVILGIIVVRNVLYVSFTLNLFDLPGERKIHKGTIPRLGGFSFFPIITFVFCLAIGGLFLCNRNDSIGLQKENLKEAVFFMAGCIPLYLVGLKDDLVGENYRYKFAVQIITAIILLAGGSWLYFWGGILGIEQVPNFVGIPFTVFLIVYITNAINLIDGIDGLASGLCVVSLVVFVVLNVLVGDLFHALIAAIGIGVILPFWYYNMFGRVEEKNKLFMGDTGSLTLGFILSYLLIYSCQDSELQSMESRFPYLFVALSSLLVPMLDVVRVVLIRLLKGRNPFLSDKNHFHHKMFRLGLSSRGVMLFIITISVVFIILNASLIYRDVNINLIILADILLWITMHFLLSKRIRVLEKK
ncbi:MAG: undecaprenyl/decaprenyl-phosphate alpha-N-acetylglucosaminyl 1-phosphate transferase [Alloprevotella sp.]|nr:undecaprenyl/decaprenyl-phosphate alpha-N-acetylglucosaminyl 1-phosphate transferase [Alloprevotella sp.]